MTVLAGPLISVTVFTSPVKQLSVKIPHKISIIKDKADP